MTQNGGKNEDQNSTAMTDAAVIDELVRKLEAEETTLEEESATEGLVCSGEDALRLLTAHPKPEHQVWAGTVAGSLSIPRDVVVQGHLAMSGSVGGDLAVWGSVGGYLAVSGEVGGNLVVGSESVIVGNVMLEGAIEGNHAFLGRLIGQYGAWGTVEKDISLLPDVDHDFHVDVLAPRTKANIFIGANVDLHHASFRGFAAYDKLRFHGDRPFQSKHARQQLAFTTRPLELKTSATHPAERNSNSPLLGPFLLQGEAQSHPHGTPHPEQASIYRQLRVAFEKNENRPAASDFYYGETEARRKAAIERSKHGGLFSAEVWVLNLYKLLSAYGTRSLRAFLSFVVVAVVAAALMSHGGIDLTGFHDTAKTEAGWDDSWTSTERWTLLRFTAQSMVSFFSPPRATNLTNAEGFGQLALRFIGPLIIAQAALAIRDRVAR